MFLLLLLAAHAADLDAYYALAPPETSEVDVVTDALKAKMAAFAVLQSETAAALRGDLPVGERAAAAARLGTLFEDLSAYLMRGTPPHFLDAHQAPTFQAAMVERALPVCDNARRFYGLALEIDPSHPEARAGAERLSVDAARVPDPYALAAEVDAWIATWPRAERPKPTDPAPSKKADKQKRRRAAEGEQSAIYAVSGTFGDDAPPSDPSSEAPPAAPPRDARQAWIDLLSRDVVQACLNAKDF